MKRNKILVWVSELAWKITYRIVSISFYFVFHIYLFFFQSIREFHILFTRTLWAFLCFVVYFRKRLSWFLLKETYCLAFFSRFLESISWAEIYVQSATTLLIYLLLHLQCIKAHVAHIMLSVYRSWMKTRNKSRISNFMKSFPTTPALRIHQLNRYDHSSLYPNLA